MIPDFPWKELGKGATVCDVGGGVGNITMQLAKAYPELQLILQDLPARVKQAQSEVWPRKCPEAIEENRVQFVPMDFLKGPPVEGCNIYYVRYFLLVICGRSLTDITAMLAPYS